MPAYVLLHGTCSSDVDSDPVNFAPILAQLGTRDIKVEALKKAGGFIGSMPGYKVPFRPVTSSAVCVSPDK